ncbi:protein obstructor-E-like [Aricia agestis]|uniref:protein obstructor-E-like n=1 Tax=Aricia agestis TaxID=91739 RepID=UPI001C20A22A|nr:protein obstructor-E-like [Aricia agestis]
MLVKVKGSNYNNCSNILSHRILVSHFSNLVSHCSNLVSHCNNLVCHFNNLVSHFSNLVSHFSNLDFQPITRTCPEGYFFNSQAQWPENPCLPTIAAQRVSTLEPQLTHLPQVVMTPSCENIRNAYIDQGLCDSYTECRNFKPIKRVCPDGLNYNPAAKWPAYPCSYPNEAPCLGRQQILVPKPTAECQRQYGIFPSPKAAANECGRYVICSAGYAYDMTCPLGLAFNPATSSCDWPYNVLSCNVNEFYGLQCPPAEIDESGNPIVVNLKYGNDCQYFFSCESGKGKLLKCDPGYAFNTASGRCENADYVECTPQGDAKLKPVAQSLSSY